MVYDHQHPALSWSGAKKLMSQPSVYKYEMANPGEPTPSMVFGSLVNDLVLLGHSDSFIKKDWTDRSNEGKQKTADAKAKGLQPVSETEWARAEACAEKARNHPEIAALLRSGKPEVPLFAIDPVTGMEMRGMIDFLGDDYAFDLKTIANSSLMECEWAARKYGIHAQLAGYQRLAIANGYPVKHLFVGFVASSPPFAVNVLRVSEYGIEFGNRLWDAALALFEQCTALNDWRDTGIVLPTAASNVLELPKPEWSETSD